MATYIIRRVLYSIPVILVSTFIIFTFVSVSGDPLAFSKMQPNASHDTIENITERKHLDDPIPVRYVLLAEGGGDGQVRDDALRRPADLARPQARHRAHPAARDRGRSCSRSCSRSHRRVLRHTPVLGLRLHGDDVQLPRFRDAGLLAGAHAPDARRRDLLGTGVRIFYTSG